MDLPFGRDLLVEGRLAEIDCAAGDSGWTLSFSRDLAHPREQVWALLTEPSLLSRWTPLMPDRTLNPAGATTVTISEHGRTVSFEATVVRSEPPALLECTWPDDRLRWDLDAISTGTRVTLRHTFGSWEWAAEVAVGWHLCFEAADRVLGGGCAVAAATPGRSNSWKVLHDAYAHKLIFAGWHDIDPCGGRPARVAPPVDAAPGAPAATVTPREQSIHRPDDDEAACDPGRQLTRR
jgi:uncharacterized protein YndB with AHSA1/START domain